MKAFRVLQRRLSGRAAAHADRNVRADCVCGARREAIPDRLWQVSDKQGDLIYPRYMYRCPGCGSFSAVDLYFPVAEYESMTVDQMHIDETKTKLNAARLAWIQERCDLPPSAMLFDLGAGEGCFAHLFANAYPRGHVLAVEADARIAAKFYGQAPNVKFVPEYIEAFLERARRDGTVPPPDLMILTDVLEHVPHPESVLRLMADVLPAGGRAYITVPDSHTFQTPFPFPVDAGDVDWEEAHHTRQHLWLLEPAVLMDLVERHMVVEDVSGFETDIRRDSVYSSVLARKSSSRSP